MSPRILLLLAVLALPATATAQRKKEDVTSPNRNAGGAPAVEPVSAKVLRGQLVEITLTGTTGSNGDMTFILRSKPKLGTLQPDKPRKKTKTSATVQYTASPDMKGDKDEFTYAAQVPGSSTCEPATVTIHISDAAPKLDTQPEVMAQRVVLGHPFPRSFHIRNTGNAPWNATVPAPHGWRWITPEGGKFSLAPGADQACEIECQALKMEDLDETVPLYGDAKIRFTARIVPPFAVLPKQLTLAWKADTLTRTGSIEVTNYDTRDITVAVQFPEWLKLPASLAIAADKKGSLALSLEGAFPQSFAGTVKLVCGSYSQNVEVKAAPAPALLAIDAGVLEKGGVHFGVLTAATLPTAKRNLTVRNDGGTAATVTVEAPEFFRLESPVAEAGFPLEPGATAAFVLLPPSDTAGTFQGDFIVKGGGAEASLFVTAGIDPAAIPEKEASRHGRVINEGPRPVSGIPRPRTEAERKTVVLGNARGFYVSDGTEDPSLPRISIVDIVADNGNTVTFGWDLPEGDGWKFQMYRATFERLKNEAPVLVWSMCGDEVKYTVEGRRATATVGELHPHSPFKFCLQTLAPNGKRSFPGKPIVYSPYPPDASTLELHWPWYVAGGVGLLVLGYWLRKKWKEPIRAAA